MENNLHAGGLGHIELFLVIQNLMRETSATILSIIIYFRIDNFIFLYFFLLILFLFSGGNIFLLASDDGSIFLTLFSLLFL